MILSEWGASAATRASCVGVNCSAMLHALLHGKLEETVLEPQGLEYSSLEDFDRILEVMKAK